MPLDTIITLQFPELDIALLVFDDRARSVNVLSRAVISELDAHLSELAKRTDIRGLMLTSAKPNGFIAGADIKELAAKLESPKSEIVDYCHIGRKIFQRLSQLPFPTVVAINGWALGGGWELSLWADGRILSSEKQTSVGFPEIKLGLMPGWGGTWTAARIAGLGNVVELVCSGEPINAQRAKQLGLADEIVPATDLIPASIRWIRKQQSQPQKWQATRNERNSPIVWSESEIAFLASTARAFILKQTRGNYPAPLAALEVLTKSVGVSVDQACELAAVTMADLVGTPVNRALVHIFFITERNKKIESATKTKKSAEQVAIDSSPGHEMHSERVKNLGVLGTGIMGAGIAAAGLKRGLNVSVYDKKPEALEAGMTKILDEVSYNKQTRKPDPARAKDFSQHLKHAETTADLANCELIIEAISENRPQKLDIYDQLSAITGPATIIASNTSTYQIGELAKSVKNPERFCGLHFFNPVRRLPLVEVVRAPQTDEQTIRAAVAFIKQIGKTPIVVNDGPGFMVNRLLTHYMNEALAIASEGVPFEEIDAAAVEFGMPIGPIAIYDLVGIDTTIFAGKTMYEFFRQRYFLSEVLFELFKHGRLGRKSGAGFYKYSAEDLKSDPRLIAASQANEQKLGSKSTFIDPTVYEILGTHLAPRRSMPTEKIIERLLIAMVLEACYVLDDRIVDDPRDIDLASVLGLAFPAFRGGVLFWADTVGVEKIISIVEANANLGNRWKVPPRMTKMAAEKKRFHEKVG